MSLIQVKDFKIKLSFIMARYNSSELYTIKSVFKNVGVTSCNYCIHFILYIGSLLLFIPTIITLHY